MADFQIEKKIIKKGFKAIAGVDEAGRGAIFGPVVAAAVILPPVLIGSGLIRWAEEIDDSKVISPPKRKRLAGAILANAVSVGIGSASNYEVDQKNIYWASLSAMRRAVENLPIAPDFILVDGFRLNDVNYPQWSIVQGDRKSISIAAASIVAKVLRDEMMIHLDKVYEGYALSKNKGYGTREHYRALKERGPTLFHRLTFNLRYK
ncbi:MAG: ribonuclease HII [Candidatus Aminicenantes bacterium]|nr:ribonuclease HII [Candidatus Aminicenantes bacterium]